MHDAGVAGGLRTSGRLRRCSEPSGFSHMTCLPALAAATAIGRWVSLGVAITTASTSSRRHTTSGSVEACSTFHSAWRFLRISGSASQIGYELGARIQPQTRQVVIGRHGACADEPHANLAGPFRCRHRL